MAQARFRRPTTAGPPGVRVPRRFPHQTLTASARLLRLAAAEGVRPRLEAADADAD